MYGQLLGYSKLFAYIEFHAMLGKSIEDTNDKLTEAYTYIEISEMKTNWVADLANRAGIRKH